MCVGGGVGGGGGGLGNIFSIVEGCRMKRNEIYRIDKSTVEFQLLEP